MNCWSLHDACPWVKYDTTCSNTRERQNRASQIITISQLKLWPKLKGLKGNDYVFLCSYTVLLTLQRHQALIIMKYFKVQCKCTPKGTTMIFVCTLNLVLSFQYKTEIFSYSLINISYIFISGMDFSPNVWSLCIFEKYYVRKFIKGYQWRRTGIVRASPAWDFSVIGMYYWIKFWRLHSFFFLHQLCQDLELNSSQ